MFGLVLVSAASLDFAELMKVRIRSLLLIKIRNINRFGSGFF